MSIIVTLPSSLIFLTKPLSTVILKLLKFSFSKELNKESEWKRELMDEYFI